MVCLDEEKKGKAERFKSLNGYAKKGQILFAGSSLMEQFPIDEFSKEMKGPLLCYNRGIGGLTIPELLFCLNECILELEPAVLFLNIGTNDLNDPDLSISELEERERLLLETVRRSLPRTGICLLAYYPVNEGLLRESRDAAFFSGRSNERIREANGMLERLCTELGLAFLDLNGPLLDEKKELKGSFTLEGIHIRPEGYRAVFDQLRPLLERL